MQILNLKIAMVQSIILVLIFSLSATNSIAQQKYKIAGKQINVFTKTERIDVGDIVGHQLSLVVSEGVNESTGPTEFGNGAQLVNVSISDLVNFNGIFKGYTKLTKKGDIAYGAYEGKIITTISPDGTPISTAEGTVTWIKGTGQFENIQGGGTVKIKYLSTSIYTSDWEGEYWIKK